MILFRPVGLRELELIADSGFRRFPPRLSWQPIFYPVLTFEYARMIATLWNRNEAEAGYVGFVTRFEIDDAFATRYPAHEAAGRDCRELWVPAEELAEFNDHIIGLITVAAAFYGEKYAGAIDAATNLPTHIADAFTRAQVKT